MSTFIEKSIETTTTDIKNKLLEYHLKKANRKTPNFFYKKATK